MFCDDRDVVRFSLISACLAILTGCGGRSAPVQPDPIVERQRAAEAGILAAGTRIPIRTVAPVHGGAKVAEQGFPVVIAGNIKNPVGDEIINAGSPARLVILPGQPARLGIGAVMVKGTWRSVRPAGQDSADGVALGTLVDAILEAAPGDPVARDKDAVTISGNEIHVPANALLIVELAEPARVVGIP